MPPSIFLRAAARTKLPSRTTSISFRDACYFIETFVNGGQRCYASHTTTHSKTSVPPSSNQPPSHRPYNSRQNLLHRTYISLLRATPLLVLFQHNNLRGNELVAIRKDLRNAMANVDAQIEAARSSTPVEEGTPVPSPQRVGEQVKMVIVNTELFSAALRVAEYLPKDEIVGSSSGPDAYDKTIQYRGTHPLEPLLVGPVGVIQFPTVSPPHILAVLNLLFPEKATFKKGTDPQFISGVSKMLLLGAKVDKVGGQTIDTGALKHVTTLGDLDTLRGQLLGLMQSAGAGLVATLQSPSKALWVMMDGRRKMLDPETQKGAEEGSSDPPAA